MSLYASIQRYETWKSRPEELSSYGPVVTPITIRLEMAKKGGPQFRQCRSGCLVMFALKFDWLLKKNSSSICHIHNIYNKVLLQEHAGLSLSSEAISELSWAHGCVHRVGGHGMEGAVYGSDQLKLGEFHVMLRQERALVLLALRLRFPLDA